MTRERIYRWVERVLLVAAVVLFGIAGVGWVQSWSDAPALRFETAEVDAGSMVVGQEQFVEVALRNTSGSDWRVVGEQAC